MVPQQPRESSVSGCCVVLADVRAVHLSELGFDVTNRIPVGDCQKAVSTAKRIINGIYKLTEDLNEAETIQVWELIAKEQRLGNWKKQKQRKGAGHGR